MSKLLNSTGYAVYNTDIVSAAGCYVYDSNGKQYLDLEAGVWALPLGHCDSDINMAMHQQIDTIMHCGYKYNHPVTEKCAQKLLTISNLEGGKCVFLTSGSEAVEYGIQLAKKIRPNKKCICLKDQYLSAYGDCMQQSNQKWISIEWDYHDTKTLDEYYEELSCSIDFSEVGIFVFEPGNSSGLVKLPPKNLVQAIAQLSNENEVIILVDEVTCGIGRTGKWFGYMHYNLNPHLIAVGKGIGNGYPVSAIIIEAGTSLEAEKANFHYAQSHQNDPFGCSVAYEVLTKIEQCNIISNSNTVASHFLEKYKELQLELPIISEIRSIGLLICIELSSYVSSSIMIEIEKKLFDQGFIVGVKPNERVIRTYCPLIITIEMVNQYINTLRSLLITL